MSASVSFSDLSFMLILRKPRGSKPTGAKGGAVRLADEGQRSNDPLRGPRSRLEQRTRALGLIDVRPVLTAIGRVAHLINWLSVEVSTNLTERHLKGSAISVPKLNPRPHFLHGGVRVWSCGGEAKCAGVRCRLHVCVV